MKKCSKCFNLLEITEFHKGGKNRIRSACKLCESLRKAISYRNPITAARIKKYGQQKALNKKLLQGFLELSSIEL